MNILIRNIESCKSIGNLGGIISAMTMEELHNDLPVDKPVTFDTKKFAPLVQDIIVTKQANGNLCIEFGEEK